MKRFLFCPRVALGVLVGFAGFGFPAMAAASTYYVSPSGNDASDGLSPGSAWRTAAKVNGSSFAPGDLVLFQRGGEWHESLISPSSGAQGNPITFADYGNGAKPKFWGSVTLDNSQFQAVGGGIYVYPRATPVYAVLANHAFFNYAFGQPAGTVAGSWSYGNGQIAINSPGSDPRSDGRVYTAVERDDVVFSNYRSHLVFRNLVVDESARYDDNGGYGFRVMGSTDVLVTDCEAYHAGKHHFGVINSTGFVGTNLTAAYAAPGQASTGGASAFVSYGDASTGLFGQTSEWHNASASHMEDPQDNTVYYAFITHGATLGSLLVDRLQSAGAGVSLTNEDNPAEIVRTIGGLIQNARLELGGNGLVIDGMEISGPQASVDLSGSNTVLQNMLIHGTNMGSAWYQTAVLSRGVNNILRFSTVDMDPAAGTNTCVALTQNNANFQYYGDALLAPGRIFALWDEGLNGGTIAPSGDNFYSPNATFAWFEGESFHWHDVSFAQWQAMGFGTASFTGNPQFVNEAQGDYHLRGGSPLIDAAPLPAWLTTYVPTDFDGHPRLQGAAFDIGAFEGAAGTVQPQAATATTLSLNNSLLAAQVTAPSGTPTGSVSFYDGTNLLNTSSLRSGAASTPVSLDPTVAHVLTAAYSGDANDKASTSQPIDVGAAAPPPAPAPPSASSYPIALLSPVNGQTVGGTVVVAAAIPQTLDAAGSFLLVDGHEWGTQRETNPPYLYALDTTQLTPGAHTLQVWAHDINNDTLLSNTVSVNVKR